MQRKSWIVFIFMVLYGYSEAQQLGMEEFLHIPSMNVLTADSLLQAKGFRRVRKETDSVSNLYYYNEWARGQRDEALLRSISLAEANIPPYQSRLVKYRTYDGDEYRQILSWLLEHEFSTRQRYRFGEASVTVYGNNREELRVQVTHRKMAGGRILEVYEFETGK